MVRQRYVAEEEQVGGVGERMRELCGTSGCETPGARRVDASRDDGMQVLWKYVRFFELFVPERAVDPLACRANRPGCEAVFSFSGDESTRLWTDPSPCEVAGR